MPHAPELLNNPSSYSEVQKELCEHLPLAEELQTQAEYHAAMSEYFMAKAKLVRVKSIMSHSVPVREDHASATSIT